MSEYTITKVRTETFVVTDITRFMPFKTFAGARKNLSYTPNTCFNCHHKFTDDEFIYLGIIKGKKNELFCEKCANELKENGVPMYDTYGVTHKQKEKDIED